MNRRTFLAACTLAAASSLLAGCGPNWIIHSQAAPDPFLNQKAFAVLPIDFAGLQIGDKSEAEYLSGKTADQQVSFNTDKAALNAEYLRELAQVADEAGIRVVPATGPDSAPFLIHPFVGWIEPGYNVVVRSMPSEVRMLVRITAPDGRVLDEIALKSNSSDYASGSRLRRDGGHLGKTTAEYLKTRVAPGQ
jgi:hypothetical protein